MAKLIPEEIWDHILTFIPNHCERCGRQVEDVSIHKELWKGKKCRKYGKCPLHPEYLSGRCSCIYWEPSGKRPKRKRLLTKRKRSYDEWQ